MGKSQKKRQMRRHNPLRVPDSHLPQGLESASASASSRKTEAIAPVIQKLQSPDAAERKWACVAVSNLIQNDPSTRRLLQGKNVVGALITRLSDSEEEVVVEAGGALRNLCIDGGHEICAEMYNKNILAPLRTFIPKLSHTLFRYLEDPKSAPENAQKLVYEFADNVITILWCLSETSNKALYAINEISLVPFLMSFLGSCDKLPITAVTSAAQCLYVLTDDNPPAVEELRTNGAYVACLLSIARPEQSGSEQEAEKGKTKDVERKVALRVLSAGILRNVWPIPPPSSAATVDIDREVVLPTLEPVLSAVPLEEASQQASEFIMQLKSEEEAIPAISRLSLKNSPKTDHRSPAEIELERLERKLRTVQEALEILTGVCATLPEPEPEAESEVDGLGEEGDEGNENDDEMEEDDEMATAEDTASAKSATSQALPSLVSPLLALIQPTPLSFPPLVGGASPHPPTTSVLSAIHICALECLNNVFLSLASPARVHSALSTVNREDGAKAWDAVWTALSAVGIDVASPGQERRREMWATASGVLWGIANVWKGLLVPQEEQVKVLIQLFESASDDALKVKCVGTLECLAQCPDAIDANRVIANYLLSLLPTPTRPAAAPIEPLLQALSALIDIYSDETLPYDINFRQGGYLAALVDSVEGVRRAVKSIDRKKERELRRRGEDVRDNLVAFIQYRRGLGL